MLERIPEKSLTPLEIPLDQDLITGEGSEGIDSLDAHLLAKQSMYSMVEDAMQGKGESAQAMSEHMDILLQATAKSYAATLQTVPDAVEMYRYGGELLHQALVEIDELSKKYECGLQIYTSSPDELGAAIEQLVNEESDKANALESAFGATTMEMFNAILNHAEDNHNDTRRIQ